MKNLFRGYYTLSSSEIKKIWDTGFISLDTNVLLNLYRYSDDTREELFKIISKYSPRLWLTYQAGYEFHKNRLKVISDQIRVYDDTIKAFEKLEEDIIKNPKTPHLSSAILQKFEKNLVETKKDLEKKRKSCMKLLTDDKILIRISKLFDKKVGSPFVKDDIVKIEKEGEDRYKKKVPPGYKDSEKSDNKYGDLIMWKELIRKSKEDDQPFILISDDVKEDWWQRTQGQTLSPRQELSQELFIEAGQTFYLYTPDRFLEYTSKVESVKQEAIDEIRGVQELQNKNFNTAWTTLAKSDFLERVTQMNNSLAKFEENYNWLNAIKDMNNSLLLNNTLAKVMTNVRFINSINNPFKPNDKENSSEESDNPEK